MKAENKFVAYYRVSTQKQNHTQYGIEAQKEAVMNFIKFNGNRIIAEFTEIESGTKSKRPQLEKALEYCKMNNAVLAVAKLDRLARNVHFISSLMQSKVKFVACDLPEMNDLTVYIFAAMAEHEAKLISERTKAGLQQAKLRGVKLGKIGNLKPEHIELAHKRISQYAREDISNRKAFHFASRLRENGKSFREIAGLLNSENYRTRRGFKWTASGIRNMLNLFKDQPDGNENGTGTAK